MLTCPQNHSTNTPTNQQATAQTHQPFTCQEHQHVSRHILPVNVNHSLHSGLHVVCTRLQQVVDLWGHGEESKQGSRKGRGRSKNREGAGVASSKERMHTQSCMQAHHEAHMLGARYEQLLPPCFIRAASRCPYTRCQPTATANTHLHRIHPSCYPQHSRPLRQQTSTTTSSRRCCCHCCRPARTAATAATIKKVNEPVNLECCTADDKSQVGASLLDLFEQPQESVCSEGALVCFVDHDDTAWWVCVWVGWRVVQNGNDRVGWGV